MIGTHSAARLLTTAFLCVGLLPQALPAQGGGRDIDTDRRERTGAFLNTGWHPHLAVGAAIPVGRLGDLVSLGVTGMLGAWYIPPDTSWPGIGIDITYATFNKSTDEPLPGRYQMAGAMLRITSKGRQRLFFDWLGGYGTAGVGVTRHGAGGGETATSPTASLSVGILGPIFGHEGFVETRVQHLFSGETLGRGNGLTFAPLMFGVRF